MQMQIQDKLDQEAAGKRGKALPEPEDDEYDLLDDPYAQYAAYMDRGNPDYEAD